MIGLEFVLKNSSISHTELAEKLGIRKQNVTRWIKGERKIPEKYLPIMEDIFKVSSQYFQKEISELDKLYILRGKDAQEVSKIEYFDTLISDEMERVLNKLEGKKVKIVISGSINTGIILNKFEWFSMKPTRNEEILKLLDQEDTYFDFYVALNSFEEIEAKEYEDGECELIFYGEEMRIEVFNKN